jgi:tetrahydromethanopterin S-methyltransferase subunit D
MATATIGVGAGTVIITAGIAAEGIITAGGIIATESRFVILKRPPAGGLFFRRLRPSPVGHMTPG